MSGRDEKTRILDEFVAVTGFHRKHAMRLLRGGATTRPAAASRPGKRLYDDAVREALVVLWEASDRICGKRFEPLLPTLVDAIERHGHLDLAEDAGGGPPAICPHGQGAPPKRLPLEPLGADGNGNG